MLVGCSSLLKNQKIRISVAQLKIDMPLSQYESAGAPSSVYENPGLILFIKYGDIIGVVCAE